MKYAIGLVALAAAAGFAAPASAQTNITPNHPPADGPAGGGFSTPRHDGVDETPQTFEQRRAERRAKQAAKRAEDARVAAEAKKQEGAPPLP